MSFDLAENSGILPWVDVHRLEEKRLSVDSLMEVVKSGIKSIEDPRRLPRITIYDHLMSALAMFFTKSKSMSAFKGKVNKKHYPDNIKGLFDIQNIPSDNALREAIDLVNPLEINNILHLSFSHIRKHGGLKGFIQSDGSTLLALDGSGYFSSRLVNCINCLQKNMNGKTVYHHQIIVAVIVSPHTSQVIPIGCEEISSQDGEGKNDCERNASKRLLARIRKQNPKTHFTVLEDGLSSNAPHISLLSELNYDFILVTKPGDHKYMFDAFNKSMENNEAKILEVKENGSKHNFIYTNDVPINKTNSDVKVNLFSYWENDSKKLNDIETLEGVDCKSSIGQKSPEIKALENSQEGQEKDKYSCVWVTNKKIDESNLLDFANAGRARWKIENETFNVLKVSGYNFEHNYGHGKENLSYNFAMLQLIAFSLEQVMKFCPLVQTLREHSSSWEDMWESTSNTLINSVVKSCTHLLSITAELLNSVTKNADLFIETVLKSKHRSKAPPNVTFSASSLISGAISIGGDTS